MNQPVNHADLALALYETACETHKRQDWRLACHALAKSLKQSLASSAAMPAPPAPPAPAPVVQVEGGQVAAPVVKGKAKAPRVQGHKSFDLSARSLTKLMFLMCSVADKRNTTPILTQVLITATGDSLEFRATNLDLEIAATVEAPGVGDWQVTADAGRLRDCLAKIDGAALVTFSAFQSDDWQTLVVTAPGVSRNMPGLAPGDFPTILADFAEKPAAKFYMSAADWSDGLAHVVPSISPEETRYYLNGAFLCLAKRDGIDVLRLVSTDGHRLGLWDRPAPDIAGGVAPLVQFPAEQGGMQGGAIIPHWSVKILRSCLPYAVTVESRVSNSGARFVCGPVTLTTKLVDGSFPDYQRVIPRDNPITAGFMPDQMTAALLPLPVPKAGVRFKWAGAGVNLSQRDMETRETVESLLHNLDYQGEPLEIALNLSYVRQALALYGDHVILRMADPASPVLLQPAKETGDTRRLNVLMPLRV